MPVMADESVPDPTESPTSFKERPFFNILAPPNIILRTSEILKDPLPQSLPLLLEQHLSSVNSNADGLFTPADFSTAATPVDDGVVLVLPSEWQEADVWGTRVVSDLNPPTELTEKPAAIASPERVNILTQTDINTLPSLTSPSEELAIFMQMERKSVLIPDPYPYCLSTPIVQTVPDDSEEENDNSVCSDDTGGRENEEVEVQFVYPDIAPHILPAMTESVSTFAPPSEEAEVTTASTPNLLDNMNVAELKSLPTLEKDTLTTTVLQYPSPPTVDFEDRSTIPVEVGVEDHKEQVSNTTQQPSEVADLLSLVQENRVSNEAHRELGAVYSDE